MKLERDIHILYKDGSFGVLDIMKFVIQQIFIICWFIWHIFSEILVEKEHEIRAVNTHHFILSMDL